MSIIERVVIKSYFNKIVAWLKAQQDQNLDMASTLGVRQFYQIIYTRCLGVYFRRIFRGVARMWTVHLCVCVCVIVVQSTAAFLIQTAHCFLFA